MAIIYTYPTKTNPTADDLVLISDSSDGNKTKNAKISSLQDTVAGVASLNTLAGNVLLSSDDSNILVASDPSSNAVTLVLASSPSVSGMITANSGIKVGASPVAPDPDTRSPIVLFEEGEWTPALEYYDYATDTYTPITDVVDMTYYSSLKGYYTKINNFVTLHFKLPLNNETGNAFLCNGLRITGLPFSANTVYPGSGSLSIFAYSSSIASSNMIVYPTGTSAQLGYLTVNNQAPGTQAGQPNDFGGNVEVVDTGGNTVRVPLSDAPTGTGGQIYLNTNGQYNQTRIGRYTNQWWGTMTYYSN